MRRGWRRSRALIPSVCLLLGTACRPGGDASRSSGAGDPRSLIEAGRYDEALASLQGAEGPEARLLTGLALTRKVEAAGPPQSGVLPPDGKKALAALDAVTTPPASHAEAQLVRAELLAPFVLATLPPPDGAAPTPTASPEGEGEAATPTEPPVEAASVVAAYRDAVDQEGTRERALKGMTEFCRKAGCFDDVDATYKALVKKLPQDKDLPAQYGDFLVEKGDRQGALDQYAIALIWRPSDPQLRGRVADIHLDIAFDHLEWGEYPQAEKAFQDARPFINSKDSPQWARLQEGLERLNKIRPQRH